MKILTLLLLLLSNIIALDFHGFFQVSLGTGGNELGKVEYLNADNEKIRAGDGFSFGGGIYVDFPLSQFSTALSLEILTSNEHAENGNINYDRIPISLMEYYEFKKLRTGAGVTYHINPHIRGSGFAKNAYMDIDSSFGTVFEMDYLISPNLYLGAHVTLMEYDFHNQKIDADRFAIIIGYRGVGVDSVKQNNPVKPVKYDTRTPLHKTSQIINYSEAKKEPIVISNKSINSNTIKRAEILESDKDNIPVKLGTTPTQKKDSSTSSISSNNSTKTSVEISSEVSFIATSESTNEKKTGEKYVPRYISDNMDTLAIEIASGNGETLDTLSYLLKIEDKEEFHSQLKKAFTKIYDDLNVTSTEVYNRIIALKN